MVSGTDASLVARRLFEQHGAAIYRFAVVLLRHHQDAEDVVQETFLKLLRHLDAMGHGDGVAVVDANFPAQRVAHRLVELPAAGSPTALEAIRTVVPPDDTEPLDLMRTADDARLPIMDELVAAASLRQGQSERLLDRFDFYAAACDAYLVVRTGEQRTYGNALLRKGVVPGSELP